MVNSFIKNRFFCLLLFLNSPVFITAMPLKLATYNIRAGLDSSIVSVGDAIRLLDPDIIAVQEIDESNERSSGVSQVNKLSEITGMKYVHFCYASNYRKGQDGHAILSKFPFDESSKLNLKLDRIFDKEERSVCTAEVTLPSGALSSEKRKVIIASAHLGLKDNAHHVQSMMSKLKYIGQERDIFLLGDLNLTPEEPSYSELIDNNYKDVLPIEKRYDTFPAIKPIKRIDYIFFNKDYSNFNINVEDIWDPKYNVIDWSRISDHYPVMVTILPIPKVLFSRCNIF